MAPFRHHVSKTQQIAIYYLSADPDERDYPTPQTVERNSLPEGIVRLYL
jgi:hypothetical protein